MPAKNAFNNRDKFGVALRKLMAARKTSYRSLSDATKTLDASGKGLSPTYLSQVTTGIHTPTPSRIELIASALRADPRYFREYREHLAAQRAKLLASEIGLDEVLAALDELEARQGSSGAPTDV